MPGDRASRVQETLERGVDDFQRSTGFLWRGKRPTVDAASARPHICIFAGFDVAASGVPQGVEIIHLAPDNLQYRFKREAMLTIKELRFETVELPEAGYQGMWLEITYDACGPRLQNRRIQLSVPSRE